MTSGKLAGPRILVAEDSTLIGVIIGEFITGEGGEVLGPYATLPAAMGAARDASLDAAVIDVYLGKDLALNPAAALPDQHARQTVKAVA